MTRLNRKCKNSSTYNKICFIHCKKYYFNYIIKIQSIWRSHIVRKKLTNLFINLPNEIQNIVLYYMREEYYKHSLYKSYANIYQGKIYKLEQELCQLFYQFQTIYSYDFDVYILEKIKIKDKINYFKSRLNEIT